MNLVGILIAPIVIRDISMGARFTIAALMLALLGTAIYLSRRGAVKAQN